MQADYIKISQLFAENRVDNSLAEIHGLLSGLLCTANPEADPEDVGQLLQPPQILSEISRKLLRQLANTSSEQLSSLEYNFQPLLPGDDSSLSARVTALGEWCEGFTVGFAAGCYLPESKLGAEIGEILADFAQFSAMGDSTTDLTDQDEVDYMELVEYVRMATIMVYQHIAAIDAEEARNDDAIPDSKFLH
ncbi:MAG: UPF0149 family protein [Pseudomonadota bacterium]